MSRYSPTLDTQFPADLRALRERVRTLENRTNVLAANTGWLSASLATGFSSTGSPYAPVGYQYEGVNGGRVRLRGRVDLTASQVAGTVMFTVGGTWAPAFTQEFAAAGTISGASNQVPVVGVDASGNVKLLVAGTSGNSLRLDGIVYSLD